MYRESIDVRLRLRVPFLLMPSASDDPFARLRFLAAAATMATIWSQFLASRRFSIIFIRRAPMKWPWPSMNPGIASWPFRSMTLVAAVISPRYLRVGADGDNFSGSDRDGLRLRLRRIQRDDFPVAQNQIRAGAINEQAGPAQVS